MFNNMFYYILCVYTVAFKRLEQLEDIYIFTFSLNAIFRAHESRFFEANLHVHTN